jgi:hypothetical protein
LQAGLAGWFWSNEQRTLAITLMAAAPLISLPPVSRRRHYCSSKSPEFTRWWSAPTMRGFVLDSDLPSVIYERELGGAHGADRAASQVIPILH